MSKNKQSKHRSIYNVVQQIPEGKVATYGCVACEAKIGDPGKFGQIVADAMMAAEAIEAYVEGVQEKIWWWRVIKKHRHKGYGIIAPEAPKEQRTRLEKDGVEFDAYGRVDLARFGWKYNNQTGRNQ